MQFANIVSNSVTKWSPIKYPMTIPPFPKIQTQAIANPVNFPHTAPTQDIWKLTPQATSPQENLQLSWVAIVLGGNWPGWQLAWVAIGW